MSKQLFPLGEVVITSNALDYLNEQNFNGLDLLKRHHSGDWGDLCDEDKEMNDDAVKSKQDRILSAYMVDGVKLYVITEWDYSVTTILLASDY
jgi:hypothetical protein